MSAAEKRAAFQINTLPYTCAEKGEIQIATKPLLQLRGICKSFSACKANDHINLHLAPGEIHALLGENGSGKSTLVKVVCGVLRADAGEILWKQKAVSITNPAFARRLGIGMVFQHFSLFDSLTVFENIALGVNRELGNSKDLHRNIEKLVQEYGLEVSLGRRIADLSAGERQRIEIFRCLLAKPQLLILDEPTSVLTPQEAESLFAILRRLAGQGCAILYISHKLREVQALCARATVLRRGRVVATCTPARRTEHALAYMMLGKRVSGAYRKPRPQPPAQNRVRLQVQGLNVAPFSPLGTSLCDVSLSLCKGEILGIAGIAGNGQRECMQVLSGERLVARGNSVRINGRAVGRLKPNARRDLGAAFIPEQRLGHAVVSDMNLTMAAFLSAFERKHLKRLGFIDFAAARDFAAEIIDRFDVRCAGPDASASSLSGGNLQKFVVGREILQKPQVLIAHQPTWGVDVDATVTIRRALLELAAEGAAVLLISQDLDEIFEVAQRVAVMSAGRLFSAQSICRVTREQIGVRMGIGQSFAWMRTPDVSQGRTIKPPLRGQTQAKAA